MVSHNRHLGGIIILMLIATSFLLILGWAWRLPLIIVEFVSSATGRWISRFRTQVSLPVPDEQDEDYLETRSYA
jgi:hypothetical protein